MATYNIGNVVRLSTGAGFYDGANALADPTVVTLKVRDPSGDETSYTFGSSAMVRASVGKYYFDLGPLTEPGTWHYRWVGTGAVVAAAEGRFSVAKSAFNTP